jgi:hypothetical protein
MELRIRRWTTPHQYTETTMPLAYRMYILIADYNNNKKNLHYRCSH